MENVNQDKFYMQLVLDSCEQHAQELQHKLDRALEYIWINGGKDHVERVLKGEFAGDILNNNDGGN